MPFVRRSRFSRTMGRRPREPVSWSRVQADVTGSATGANALELFSPPLVVAAGQDLRLTVMRSLLTVRIRFKASRNGGAVAGNTLQLFAGLIIDKSGITNAGDLPDPSFMTAPLGADAEADWMWLGAHAAQNLSAAAVEGIWLPTQNLVNTPGLVDVRAKRKLTESDSVYLVTRTGPFTDGTAIAASPEMDLQAVASFLWQRTMKR